MRPPTPMPKGSVQRLAPLLKETDDLKSLSTDTSARQWYFCGSYGAGNRRI